MPYDPIIHQGKIKGILVAMTDMFQRATRQPDASKLFSLYQRLRNASAGIKRVNNNDLFRPSSFRQLVDASRLIAGRLGYIP